LENSCPCGEPDVEGLDFEEVRGGGHGLGVCRARN